MRSKLAYHLWPSLWSKTLCYPKLCAVNTSFGCRTFPEDDELTLLNTAGLATFLKAKSKPQDAQCYPDYFANYDDCPFRVWIACSLVSQDLDYGFNPEWEGQEGDLSSVCVR